MNISLEAPPRLMWSACGPDLSACQSLPIRDLCDAHGEIAVRYAAYMAIGAAHQADLHACSQR